MVLVGLVVVEGKQSLHMAWHGMAWFGEWRWLCLLGWRKRQQQLASGAAFVVVVVQ